MIFGAHFVAHRYLLLPLHSELSTSEQKQVFRNPPAGKTKVVLSTNIAEASVTIDDVSFVVDCGTHKEMQYDPHTSMAALVQARISRANAAQRAGRAGRVRAGLCYHLFLKWEDQNAMLPQQLPEIQRSPLEMTCLRIKTLGLGSIAAALAQAPEPPGAHAVDHVLRVLSGLGLTQQLTAGTASESQPEPQQEGVYGSSTLEVEKLTPLGEAVASLPVDPRIGKLVLLGAVFRCLQPTLILAASLATRSPFVSPFAKRDEAAAAKRSIDDWSDHMALLAAYRGWKDCGSGANQKRFADENFLSHNALQSIGTSIDQFKRQLRALKLYRTESAGAAATYDEHSDNLPLVRALLVAALYPNIATITASVKRQEKVLANKSTTSIPVEIRTVDLWSRKAVRKASTDEVNDRVVKLHPSSVLCAQQKLGALVLQQRSKQGALFVVFHGRIKTSQVFICDASVVSAMPILLLAGTVDTQDDVDEGHDEDGDEAEHEHEEDGDVSEVVADSSTSGMKSDADTAAPVTLEIDGWLRFSTSAPQAQLFIGLRRCIAALLRSKLGANQLDESAASKIVAAVASIVKESDCSASAAEPLPKGWESVEDPSSATGRVFFRNLLSGKTQRERPTRAATAASTAKSTPGVRLPPPTLAPPPKELTEEEKQVKAAKAEEVARARLE